VSEAKKPSPSPSPTSAENHIPPTTAITRPKGVARLSFTFAAIPMVGCANAAGATTYATSSILQIIFAGLFDKDNPFFTVIKEKLVDVADLSLWATQNVISFEVDQIKEALVEICGKEDFVRHFTPEQEKKVKEVKNTLETKTHNTTKDDKEEDSVDSDEYFENLAKRAGTDIHGADNGR